MRLLRPRLLDIHDIRKRANLTRRPTELRKGDKEGKQSNPLGQIASVEIMGRNCPHENCLEREEKEAQSLGGPPKVAT